MGGEGGPCPGWDPGAEDEGPEQQLSRPDPVTGCGAPSSPVHPPNRTSVSAAVPGAGPAPSSQMCREGLRSGTEALGAAPPRDPSPLSVSCRRRAAFRVRTRASAFSPREPSSCGPSAPVQPSPARPPASPQAPPQPGPFTTCT